MPVITVTPSGMVTDKPVRTLKNLTGSSIMLEISPGNVVSVAPDESLFYDSTVNSDVHSPDYNLDHIQALLDQEVFEDVTEPLKEPVAEVESISGGTFVANILSQSAIKVLSKQYSLPADMLEVLPVVDVDGKLLAIYYRTSKGIAYSLNNGMSAVLISNDNLKYVDEVTSMAVQLYESAESTSAFVKLFIGTLREGIKTFVPGRDVTYVDFVDYESISRPNGIGEVDENDPISASGVETPTYRNDYLFRNYRQNLVPDYEPNTWKYAGKNGATYSHIFTDMAPTYVLGVMNHPKGSGCPLVVYSRTLKDGKPSFKYCVKNLHTHVHRSDSSSGRLVKAAVATELTTPWNRYQSNYAKADSGWIVLQHNKQQLADIGFGVLPENVTDVLRSQDLIRSSDPGSTSTLLVAFRQASIKSPSGIISVLKLSATSDMNGSGLTYASNVLENLPDPARYAMNFSGLSAVVDPKTGKETVFMTFDDCVWKYDATWAKFIHKDADISSVYSTKLTKDRTFATRPEEIFTSLTGLRGFSMALVPNSLTDYVALMSSDLGVIQYTFSYQSGKLVSKAFSKYQARQVRYDLYNGPQTDLVIPTGTNMVFSSSLKTSLPISYTETGDVFFTLTPSDSDSHCVYFERKNYGMAGQTESMFYSGKTYSTIKYVPSDQVLTLNSTTTDSVSIKKDLGFQLQAPAYLEKFRLFAKDGSLYSYLNRCFGKYIHLYVTQIVEKSIKATPYEYVLQGSSDYYVPVSAVSIVFDENLVGYTVANYIRRGYTSESY